MQRSLQACEPDPRVVQAWERGLAVRLLDSPSIGNTRRCPQPDCCTSNFCAEMNRAHLQSCEEILRGEEPVWFPKFNAVRLSVILLHRASCPYNVNLELLMFCAL